MTPAFTHLAEVGSTNDWLLARAGELPDMHWVIADRQTAGRGRRGRVWNDGAGNFMGSVLVKAEGPVQQLSFVAAVALHEAVSSLTSPCRGEVERRAQRGPGEGAHASAGLPLSRLGSAESDLPPAGGGELTLKWPNDLLLDGVKVAGILLERAGDALVIGIGVNLASHPEGTERPATSIAAAGLPVPAPIDLLHRLMPAFAAARAQWEGQGFGPIRTRWLAHAAGLGGRIVARLGGEDLTGSFAGLEGDGALALRLDNGTIRTIHAGEVFAL